MALDFQTALDQYGFVGVMAQGNPELSNLLHQAVTEEWDSARFQRKLADTQWYKSQGENQRAADLQKATDPATWNEQVANKAASIDNLAGRLGVTRWYGKGLADLALTHGWTDEQIQAYLLDNFSFGHDANGALLGNAGEVQSHIKQSYADYGLAVSDSLVETWAKQVLAGRNSLGGIDNQVRSMAKKQYPGFADLLDSGQTLKQIADPYVQTMANTLELDGNAIGLNDPNVKKALQGTSGTPMTMWQFERSLKDDARWQMTKNAKNEAYSTLQQVGKDWGLGG